MTLREIPPSWRAPAGLLAFAGAILAAWFVLSTRAEASAEKIASASAAVQVAPIANDLTIHKVKQEGDEKAQDLRIGALEERFKTIDHKMDDILERLPAKK